MAETRYRQRQLPQRPCAVAAPDADRSGQDVIPRDDRWRPRRGEFALRGLVITVLLFRLADYGRS
jgi:hypothetical protein